MVEPLIDPDVAVIMVTPDVATPVAKPFALIVATPTTEEDHATAGVVRAVNVCVVPSLNVPVAVNCSVVPAGIVVVTGVMAIDCKIAAAVTVSVVEPLMAPDLAVMVVVPTAMPVASPLAALIVAVDGALELQVAVVRVEVLLSLNVPIAVNCWVSPAATVGVAGVTEIEVNVTVGGVVPPPPQPVRSATVRRRLQREKTLRNRWLVIVSVSLHLIAVIIIWPLSCKQLRGTF